MGTGSGLGKLTTYTERKNNMFMCYIINYINVHAVQWTSLKLYKNTQIYL